LRGYAVLWTALRRRMPMPIRTITMLELGKVKIKTTAWAPMLPALRATATFSLVPPVSTGRKRRRTKKKR
jgi:hypothetical protein